jgi:hypothetical protein
MQDENWYFRNRSRDAIVDMFRVVRQLQILCNFKNSDIIRQLASIYRATDGEYMSKQLYWLAMMIDRDERQSKQ